MPLPLVCVEALALTAVPILEVPSKTLNCGTVVQVPPNSVVTVMLAKWPAMGATVSESTELIAKPDDPNKPEPAEIVPFTAEIVSVIVPEEFVQREKPVAGVPVSTRSCEVTDAGAWKQIEVAVLHGATAALVVPCGKSTNPAVVPLEVNDVADAVPAKDRFPPELNVEVVDGVWSVVVPPPVTSAVLVRLPAPTTVTVPDPLPHAAHDGLPLEFSWKQFVPEPLPANFVQVVPLPTIKSPAAAEDRMDSVTVLEEFVHSRNPVAAAPGRFIK